MPKFDNILNLRKENFSFKEINSSLIPYACYYDPDTIITKNGELLQIIKISDLSPEMVNHQHVDLRSKIQELLNQKLDNNNFSICFNFIRKKADITQKSDYKSVFANDLNVSWCEKNYFHSKFINEIYITIIYEGQDFNLSTKNESFLNKLSINHYKKEHTQYLENSSKILTSKVEEILLELTEYGAKKLGLKTIDNIVYSEHYALWSYIISNEEKLAPLDFVDLSEKLCQEKIVFGNDIFEILTKSNKKYYGVLFSLKRTHNFKLSILDELLRLPEELIITETVNFIDNKKADKHFSYLQDIYRVSNDPHMVEACGLEDFKHNTSRLVEQQITFMIRVENKDLLKERIQLLTKKLNKLGLVFIKEDLNIENCYFSQLGGNFNYLKRIFQQNSNQIASFCSINNSPSGELSSPWGQYVTIFRSQTSIPYFFNFHNSENIGHTLVLGPTNTGKATLVNFLLSQASKFNPIIFYLDQTPYSEVIINLLSGTYFHINDQAETPKLNPLLLEENDYNRNFLLKWFAILISQDIEPTSEIKKSINELINLNYQLPINERNLTNLLNKSSNLALKQLLSPWLAGNKLGFVFDHQSDVFADPTSDILGFNFEFILSNPNLKEALLPLTLYLTYHFNIKLNNLQPGIIFFNDASHFMNNNIFNKDYINWLDELTKSNAITIFALDSEALISNPSLEYLVKNTANHIYLPDKKISDQFLKKIDLNEQEIKDFKSMRIINRNIMINKSSKNTVIELNLDGLDYIIKSLIGNKKTNEIMKIAKSKHENYEDWLAEYYNEILK